MTDENTPAGSDDPGTQVTPEEPSAPKWSWGRAESEPGEPKKSTARKWPWGKKATPVEPETPVAEQRPEPASAPVEPKKPTARKWPWGKKATPVEPEALDDSYWSEPVAAPVEPAPPAPAQWPGPEHVEAPVEPVAAAPAPWSQPEPVAVPVEPVAAAPAPWSQPEPVAVPVEPAPPAPAPWSQPEPVAVPVEPVAAAPAPWPGPEHVEAPVEPVAAASVAVPIGPAAPAQPVAPVAPVSPSVAVPAVTPQPQSGTSPQPVPAMMTQPVPVMAPPMPSALGPTIPSGSRVVVMVSRGPSPMAPSAYVMVPAVVGMPQGDALAKLQEAGLPSQVFNDYSQRLPRGQVLGQLPVQNSHVPSGSESVLIVSSGPAAAPTVPTTLPNVVGLPESDAVSRLQGAGLSPQLVREYSAGMPDGIVIAQLPNSASLIDMPKKRSLLWLWILLAILLAAAFGVAGYLYLNRTGVVPAVVGLTQADATTAIESAGFKLGSVGTTQTLKASEVGKVVAQSPSANSEQKMTTGIGIVVSGGQKLIDVPTATGKTQSEAEKALTDVGLKASVSKGFSSTVLKGVVISQAPEAGQKVPSDTSVGIVVSEGAQNVTVPGVSGQTQSQATTILKSLGLGSQVVTNYSTTTKGEVEEQFPAAGTGVPPGTIIGLIVSGGSTTSTATVSVPNVVGKTSSQAETDIKAVALKVVAVQWSGTGKPANEVVGQIPGSGSTVPKNSSVLIFVSNGK